MDEEGIIYHLVVVQTPVQCAEFGDIPLARIPLNPPLIVRLDKVDERNRPAPVSELNGFLVGQLLLLSADGTELVVGPQLSVRNPLGQVMRSGTITSDLKTGVQYPEGRYRDYFVFPDVGVKVRGQYRLQVELLQLGNPGGFFPRARLLAAVVTEPFQVFPRAGYITLPPTTMTLAFQSEEVQMYLSVLSGQ